MRKPIIPTILLFYTRGEVSVVGGLGQASRGKALNMTSTEQCVLVFEANSCQKVLKPKQKCNFSLSWGLYCLCNTTEDTSDIVR